MMDCGQARTLTEALFARPDGPIAAALWPHLRECESCRSFYDRLFAAEAALGRPGDALARSEMALLGKLVLPPTPRPRVMRVLLPAVAALVAAGIAALLLLQPFSGRELDGFRARGAAGRGDAAPLIVRPLCLRARTGKIEVSPLSSDPADPRRCRVGDRLGFSARNETGQALHLRLIALRSGKEPLLLGGDFLLAPSGGEAPLSFSSDLAELGAGRAVLLSVFSARELDRTSLLASLREKDRAGLRRIGVLRFGEVALWVGE